LNPPEEPQVRLNSYHLGLLLATLAACGFAAKAIFAKLAYRYGVDGVTMVTLRLLLVLPLLALFRLYQHPQTTPLARRDKAWLVLLGLLGYYLSSLLDFLGLETVSASVERMILCLYPTLTVLFSAWLSRTAISLATRKALLLSYFGMALVLIPDLQTAQAQWQGVLFIAASTLTYALYLTWSPAVIQRVGSMRFTELALGVSALAMFLHFAITRSPQALWVQPLPVWGYGLAMALFSTVLPLYALSAAMVRIGAGKTAIIGSLGPILTIIMSMQLLDEWLSPLQWCGVILVLAGIWQVGKRRH
jgi:drug/metabolite transporter (DMT)-like permease